MTAYKAHNAYKQSSINTARPEELTLMLYNGLIKFLMRAQLGLENNEIEKANDAIIRCEDIIQELMISLDMQYPVAQTMNLLYDYLYRRLVDANIKKEMDIIDEVLVFAKELRDTWEQAIKIAKNPNSKPQVTIVSNE